MDTPDAEEIHQAAALDATGEWLPGIEHEYEEEWRNYARVRELARQSAELIEELRGQS